MNLCSFMNARWRSWRMRQARRAVLRAPGDDTDPVRSTWADSLRDPTRFYLRCFRFFHRELPRELRDHRNYFSEARRGFGEDAFHVMWFLLFREFKPERFLEIGVYRGQTTSLAAMLAGMNQAPCEVHGISPFSSAGDSVSKYEAEIDYYRDTLRNFLHFRLPQPGLLKAYSTDAAALTLIASRPWDMIYIDGNHDYEVVRKDWGHCAAAVRLGGLVIMDDSGLTTNYDPPNFATGGHPGPSQVASEVDATKFKEILQVGHNRVFQKVA